MTKMTTSIIPLASSKKGCNAYYCEFCPHVGNRPSYAACLNRIDKVNADQLAGVDSVCVVAIQRGYCEALEMREREMHEGKALYFIDRAEIQKDIQARLSKQGISIGNKNKSALTFKNAAKKVETVKEEPKTSVGNLTMADAINRKLKEHSSVPENNAVKSVSDNKVSANLYLEGKTLSNIKSGMSLAEIANSLKTGV